MINNKNTNTTKTFDYNPISAPQLSEREQFKQEMK